MKEVNTSSFFPHLNSKHTLHLSPCRQRLTQLQMNNSSNNPFPRTVGGNAEKLVGFEIWFDLGSEWRK